MRIELDVNKDHEDRMVPRDPLVCPKSPGFPRINPMSFGDGIGTINPTMFREGWEDS